MGARPGKQTLGVRLDRIRDAVALLGRLDPGCSLFGASHHRWTFAPPYSADELRALERSLGVTFPEEYSALVTTLGRAGAGPYYGLESPRPVGASELVEPEGRPSHPFPFEKKAGHRAAIPQGARRYDGVVYVAMQGCGYFSVLVVTGARAGAVWSDTGHGGGPIEPEARSFLAFYEAWIDRTLLEWARYHLADVASARAEDDPPHEGVEAVRPLLASRRAGKPSADGVRLAGWLALYDRAFDDALRCAEEAASLEKDEPERRCRLDRARVRNAQGAWGEALEEAQAGLAAKGWYATEDRLRVEQIRALRGLGRDDEVLAALEARAEQTYWDTPSFYAVARAWLERGEVERAGRWVKLAVQRGAGSGDRYARLPADTRPGHPNQLPLADRVEDVLAPFLVALAREGREEDVARVEGLRAEILAAASAP